jgi:hypothetical protein
VSEQTQRYARAKWIVEANAKVQAMGDAATCPKERMIEIIMDPMTYTLYEGSMKSWRYGIKAQLVFVQMNEKDYELLTYEEKQELIQIWIDLFYQEVMKLLKERYERESNATSN